MTALPALLLAASLALQEAPAAAPGAPPQAEPPPAAAAADPPAVAEPAAAAAAPALTGAPSDDYGFTAWCRGALTGHMELAASASPEIARVEADKATRLLDGKSGPEAKRIRAALKKDAAREAELDSEQQKAGREYLALYKSALDAAEAAGANRTRGEEAAGQGYRIWSAARAAPPQTQMYSYLMWELPGRCETAAKSLKANSGLLGAAFKKAEAPPAQTDAAPLETAPPSPAPASGEAVPTEPAAPPSPATDLVAAPATPPSSEAPPATPAPALRPPAAAPGA